MGAAHERFVTRDVPHAMGTQSLPRMHQLSRCVLNQTRCITADSRTLTSDEGRTARNSTALLERHDKQFFWIFADAKMDCIFFTAVWTSAFFCRFFGFLVLI